MHIIYKTLKITRVVWSLAVLLIFLSIFLLPENISELAADWQIIPAAISSLALFSFGILVFFIIEAILFGRIFCSFTCPLGVLQDIAIRLGKIFRLPRKNKLFTTNRRTLRYSFLAILAGALFLGVAIPLGLFGPFAIFGRFAAAVVKPTFIRLNNLMVDNALIEGLQPLHYTPFSLLLLLVASVFFIVIMITASFRGRLFCNTLCPAGQY